MPAVARASVGRWARVIGVGTGIGVLSGFAVFGVVVVPLFFFAAVTEPSTGTQRPLFTVGTQVALWLGVAVGIVAGLVAGRWRALDREDREPGSA